MRLSINSSSSNNNNNDDVIINIREDSRRIGDEDSTLKELIKNDRNLVLFLLVLGFHINDERNSTTITILARTWQFILLLLGGIGFCWQTFIYGGHHVASLYEALTSSTSKSIGIFIEFGLALKMFIVPLAQVTSLMYGVSVIYKQIDQPVNVDIASPILASCKRTTIIFFVCVILLIAAIDPVSMTSSWYESEFVDHYDDGHLNEYGEQSYSLFVFNRFTVNIFFSLSVTCYLSVVLLFKSFSMKLICTMQADAMKIINTDKFELDKYLAVKQKIISLKNGTYFSSQLLTFTAAINVITFMFLLWLNHHKYIKATNGNSYDDDNYYLHVDYSTMLIHYFEGLSYLFKGTITLYYYYHYHSYKYHY